MYGSDSRVDETSSGSNTAVTARSHRSHGLIINQNAASHQPISHPISVPLGQLAELSEQFRLLTSAVASETASGLEVANFRRIVDVGRAERIDSLRAMVTEWVNHMGGSLNQPINTSARSAAVNWKRGLEVNEEDGQSSDRVDDFKRAKADDEASYRVPIATSTAPAQFGRSQPVNKQASRWYQAKTSKNPARMSEVPAVIQVDDVVAVDGIGSQQIRSTEHLKKWPVDPPPTAEEAEALDRLLAESYVEPLRDHEALELQTPVDRSFEILFGGAPYDLCSCGVSIFSDKHAEYFPRHAS